jgi:hypothetical protein
MRFYDTRALLLPREGVHLQWCVEPEDTDLTTIEVELQRSESPSGPWVKLQVFNPFDTFAFTDRTVPWKPKSFEIYYQLVGVLKTSGDPVTNCRPFGFQAKLPLDAIEIIRQHNILLKGVNGHEPLTGIETTVYKRRTFGPRCTTCVDAMTGRRAVAQCDVCSGTGFSDRGYYNPIPVAMNLQPHPSAVQITNLGKVEDNETVAFMTNFPIMYPGDMVVEPDEKHWRVVHVDVTERKRVVVHQSLRLRQLDHNDIEYEVLRHLDNQGVTS